MVVARLSAIVLFLFSVSAAYAQVPPYLPPNGLVAWWSLNGNAADGVGNNHGTVNGATATTDRYGNPNSAYAFDGVDDNITLPNAINFNVNSFTISLYCQVRQWGYANGTAYIFGSPIEDGNNPHGFRLSHVANRPGLGGSGFEAVMADQAYDDYFVYSNQPVNTGWWYNVAMVYDRQTQTFALYVNGQLAGQEMVAAGFGMTDRGFSPTIGAYKLQTLVNSYFKGKIDDIAVWNRALTAQEIMMSYKACDFSIISQPTNATVDAGSNATLTVAPTQNTVLYRWQRKVNGAFVEVTDPTAYSGAYTATLTINNVDATLTGTYRCEMTLNNCTVVSDEVQVEMRTTSGIPSYVPQDGLVGWWPFNGDANDESGNGRNFMVIGASIASGKEGTMNTAYSFDGVDDQLSVNIDQSAEYTLSVWLYLNSADRIQGAFQYKYPCIRGGGTAVTASYGKLGSATIDCGECLPYTCNNWSGERTDLADLGSEKWRHVVLSVNGVDKFRFYVDGVLVNTYTNAELISTYPALPLILGKVHDENAFYFDGKIDDVGYWDRELSSQEITALFSACDISITQQPNNANVAQGDTKAISVAATSAKALSYQWQKDAGSGFTNIANGGSYSGATTASLTISSFSSATAAPYRCVISTSECSVNSNAAILTLGSGQSDTNFITGVDFPYTKVTGTELYVSPTGSNATGTGTASNPYGTIQYAIDQAVNDQIVTLLRGTYKGTGNYNLTTRGKRITVQSHEGPLVTIIDCELNGRGFHIQQGENNSTVIKGLAIINGKNGPTAPFGGSAIFVEDNSGVTITDCLFRFNGNGCIQLGRLEVTGPQSSVLNCAFVRNNEYCINSSKKSTHVSSCLFLENVNPNDGLTGNGHVTNPASSYEDCIYFANNAAFTAALGHGALVKNTLFINNTTTQGTAAFGTNWSGTNTIDHCTFYDNTTVYKNSSWGDHTGTVKSTIFYPGAARDHVTGTQSSITYSYSLGNGITGNGNILGNPLFANPAANDFSLSAGSPCIGTGESGTNMGADFTRLSTWMFDMINYYTCDITITQQPTNANVAQGDTKAISVAATSAKALSYQWQQDAGSGFTNLANGGSYSGAATATLTISSFTSATAASYRCVVSTSECSVNSDAAVLTLAGSVSTWSRVLDSAQAQLANFVFYPTAFDQVNNRVFAINATTNPMTIKIIDLDDASVETFQVSRPISRIDAHTYDPTGNRLVLTRSGRDKVYALNLTTKSWAQIGNGSNDDDSYGSVLYWNKGVNGAEFFAGYGYTTAKNWVYRNTGGNWVNIVANQSNCEPRKRPGAWSSLGHPDSNQIFFSSGEGNCSGVQAESSCAGGAIWASDIGKWCWLKDLYRYDISAAKFSNLRPFSDASYVGEGPIAYDYHENKMYQFPQFIPSATWGVAATTFDKTDVYSHTVGGSQGYELVQTSGTLPPARTSGTAFYDGTNKRLVLMRTDGMWAMQLGQSDCDITVSDQPSSPTVYGGHAATLSVTATAPSAITYQWQRLIGGVFVDLVDGTEYSGTNTDTLNISMVRVSASGPYRCVLTTSECNLTTNEVTLNVDCPCNMK